TPVRRSMECAGRAKRRRRFGGQARIIEKHSIPARDATQLLAFSVGHAHKSGVALRLPRQSKTLRQSTSNAKNIDCWHCNRYAALTMFPPETTWPHAPTHRFDSHGTYFVTSSTLSRAHQFRGKERLAVLHR